MLQLERDKQALSAAVDELDERERHSIDQVCRPHGVCMRSAVGSHTQSAEAVGAASGCCRRLLLSAVRFWLLPLPPPPTPLPLLLPPPIPSTRAERNGRIGPGVHIELPPSDSLAATADQFNQQDKTDRAGPGVRFERFFLWQSSRRAAAGPLGAARRPATKVV